MARKKRAPTNTRPAKTSKRPERPPESAPLPPAGSTQNTSSMPTAEAVSEPRLLTIVGVGASAGGFEAFSQMLEPLSPSGDLAIVFVQHLSPQHESALADLLSAKTSFRVVQVTDHLRVEPNHVYVIPPNVQI